MKLVCVARGAGVRLSSIPRASIAVLACLMLTAACSSSKKTPSGPIATSAGSSVTSSSAAPSPTPSSSAPLSPFEADAAVVALRAWARQSAMDFNNGQNYTDPALTALETPAFAARAHQIYDEYVGTTFPGPFPLAPQMVRVTTPTQRLVDVCALDEGWAQDPATKLPAKAKVVDPSTFYLALSDGKWLVDGSTSGTFSCATVNVPTQTW
jgi:hypothetical protein